MSTSMQHIPEPGHRPPSPPGARPSPEDAPEPTTNPGVDRGRVMGVWLRIVARWSGRLILGAAALLILLWGLSALWVGILPVVLALIVSALLSPAAEWMRARGFGDTLAAAVTLTVTLMIVVGILLFIAPDIVDQVESIGGAALNGVDRVQAWLAGPPFEVSTERIDDLIDQAVSWMQDRGGDIASGAFSGVAAAGSLLVNTALVLVLTFFFLKDGARFLPWLRTVAGRNAGWHLTEVLVRNWKVLGGFIRTQALVSAIDAVFIGLGLLLLGVPLALALAVITFLAGFIPIVGAVTAGALAVLVALVSNGWQIALAVLVVVLLVQQLEGNVLSPILQGKTMQVHPALILIAVTIGGTIFGIAGAFLAVPFAACLVVTARYLSEQLDLRTGAVTAEELPVETSYGKLAAVQGENASSTYRAGVEDENTPPGSATDEGAASARSTGTSDAAGGAPQRAD